MMDMNKMLQNADWKFWMVVQVWFHKMLISFFTCFFQSEACGGKFQKWKLQKRLQSSVHKHVFCKNVCNSKKCVEKKRKGLFAGEGVGGGMPVTEDTKYCTCDNYR